MYIKGVLKLTSPTIAAVGISILLCSIISLIYNEDPEPLLLGGGAGLGMALIMWMFGRNADSNNFGLKEGAAVTTLTWVLGCVAGAIPFYTMGWSHPELATTWTKSYYEIMSGLTTTGSSIFSDVEILPRGILFWRSFSHWIGGMGIVVLAIAILPKLGIGGLQAFRMESPGPMKGDKLVPRISQSAKLLYTIYLLITIIELILLVLVGLDWFDAAVYTFGTVGTGGFAVHNTSVAGLHNHAAEYIIASFMWLSGVNFGLTYFAIFKGQVKNLFKDAEFRVYAGIVAVSVALIMAGLLLQNVNGWNVEEAFRYAFFQVSTLITTTGYATTDYGVWPAFPLIILMILLFVGGSTGSTGGGLKVLRHMINFKFMRHELIKLVKPNVVTPIKIGSRTIEQNIVNSVVGLTFMYFLVFVTGAVIVSATGQDLVTSVTASIANLGNVGPGLNVVGPVGNYSSFHPIAIWTMTFSMLLGRLEVFTVLVLFIPTVWMMRHRKKS